MNNSKVALDNLDPVDKKSILQTQHGELTQIAEALLRIESSEDWRKLKRMLLDGVVSTLEKQLTLAVSGDEVDMPKIYRLQGQLAWAKKYVDLKKLAEVFKLQVNNLNKQLDE